MCFHGSISGLPTSRLPPWWAILRWARYNLGHLGSLHLKYMSNINISNYFYAAVGPWISFDNKEFEKLNVTATNFKASSHLQECWFSKSKSWGRRHICRRGSQRASSPPTRAARRDQQSSPPRSPGDKELIRNCVNGWWWWGWWWWWRWWW